jgi:hypothetical protein
VMRSAIERFNSWLNIQKSNNKIRENSHNAPAIITFKHNNTYEVWAMKDLNILKLPLNKDDFVFRPIKCLSPVTTFASSFRAVASMIESANPNL